MYCPSCAVPEITGCVLFCGGATASVASYAPASHEVVPPAPGRVAPRSSVVIVHAAAGTSSMAELGTDSARVCVGPPLFARDAARSMVELFTTLLAPKLQLSSDSTLCPPSTVLLFPPHPSSYRIESEKVAVAMSS